MHKKINKLIPFLVILIIFLPWIGFRFVYANYYKTEDTYLWYVYSDLGLILVATVGYFIWHFFFKIEWLKKIWVIIYGLIILLFVLTTIVSFFNSQVTNDSNIKTAFIGIRSVFISPFPFLLLWLFSKKRI